MSETNTPSAMPEPVADLTITEPREVDIGRLEKELNSLLVEATNDTSTLAPLRGPVTRVVVANLILVVPTAEMADQLANTVAELAMRNPARIVVITAQPDHEATNLRAYVRAHCHKTPGGNRVVCSEHVQIDGVGSEVFDIPYIVMPLLMPDVPTFLWWRAGTPVENRLFKQLSEFADRVVLNSSEFELPDREFGRLWRMIRESGFHAAINDIGWTRLATWRELVAQFFDIPEYGRFLPALNRVTIEYEATTTGAVSPRALLMTGWLASRLNWKPASPLHRSGKDRHLTIFTSDSQTVAVEMKSIAAGIARQGGLLSIELASEEEEQATFSVSRIHQERGYADTSVTVGDNPPITRVLPMEFPTEAELMVRQFRVIGHDTLFEEALEMAASLARG